MVHKFGENMCDFSKAMIDSFILLAAVEKDVE